MATTYNTLSLESKETRKSRSVATYVAVGLLVVALAGAGSFVALNHTNSAVNAEFDDFKGNVVSCWARVSGKKQNTAAAVEGRMPRYDPKYSSKEKGDRSFYNACYYSYSCCTEVSLMCLASQGYGRKCRQCISENGPKMVLPLCEEFLVNYSKDSKKPSREAGQKWGLDDLMANRDLPTTNIQAMKRKFQAKRKAGVKKCWKRVGSSDPRMSSYTKNCWDAISWCNLLCPRDDDTTVDEKMCKECVNLGFQQNAPERFTKGHTFLTHEESALKREVIRSASNKNK